jgi:hypothetical protein
LRRVVAEVVVAERVEQRLRAIAASGDEGALEAELALARAHRDTTKSIIAGMTCLRATPRARVELRAARSAFARAPSGPRPWDIEAQATESEAEDGDETA